MHLRNTEVFQKVCKTQNFEQNVSDTCSGWMDAMRVAFETGRWVAPPSACSYFAWCPTYILKKRKKRKFITHAPRIIGKPAKLKCAAPVWVTRDLFYYLLCWGADVLTQAMLAMSFVIAASVQMSMVCCGVLSSNLFSNIFLASTFRLAIGRCCLSMPSSASHGGVIVASAGSGFAWTCGLVGRSGGLVGSYLLDVYKLRDKNEDTRKKHTQHHERRLPTVYFWKSKQLIFLSWSGTRARIVIVTCAS